LPGPGTAADGFLDGPRFRTTFSGVTHASPSLLPDSPPDEGFDRLTRLAARLLGAPSAMITFLRDDHAFFQSAVGLPEPWASRRRAPLSLSFCRHVVTSGLPLVVDDARRHPLVRSSPAIRELGWIAYAGVPLAAPGGQTLGALAVADSLPRLWSPRDVALLEDLAASVVAELELRSRPPAAAAPAPAYEAPAADPADGVFDASALPMGLILPDGRWLRVNRALAGLLGTTPEALTGCPAEAFTHPADRTADREAIRLLLAGECASYSAEKRLLRQGEEPVWVASTVTLLPAENGTPGPLHVAFHDITDRKRGELELRAREERYRLAAESTRDAVWDWDLLTDRIVWGERSAGRFGYHRHGGGTSATWWYERLHPDDRERVVSGMQTAIARVAEEWTEEYRFRRADGSWAHVRSHAAIVRDEAGDAVRLVGAVLDVTEEVRAGLLARGQSRLLEQIAVGLELPAVLDRIARFAEAHGSDLVACVMLLDADAGVLRPAAAPSLPSEVRAALARPVTSRDPVVAADLESGAETHGRGPLLELGLRAAWLTPLFASDGGLLGALDLYCREARAPNDGDTVLMEIAGHLAEIAIERERGQEALARGTRVLEQVLDSLPIGVWVLDGEGSIIFGNPAGRAIWGGARYVGLAGLGAYRGWRVDTGAPIAAEQWGAARAILQGETSLDELVRIEAFDGVERTILSSAVPLRSLAGEVVGAILLHQDVSEQRKGEEALRRSEAQLRHAQKMEAVGQLAGGIAHDFNNLLTGILSYADLVLGELRPGDPIRADLEQIRHAAQRAAALTRQLLAFSRRQVLQPHVLSLNGCVAELDAILRRLLGADVTLDTELDPGLWYVQADPGQLEQVLVNLVVNARDAMPAGGRVTIATANLPLSHGAYATLSVSDTGIGMDAATQARIFDPFFTTKEQGKGTGLGLSTVYGIVEQSGGHVTVESAPGEGATFTIFFPRHSAPALGLPPGADRRSLPGGTETLLLVEDEAAVRTSARRLLERQGYTVVEARHGADALRIFEEGGRPIDLVLTDLVMPEMGGRELVERLRARHPGVKVLYMSGYSERAVAVDGVMPPRTGFVEKPFTVEQLIRRTREILDG
jgi:two-component system, cell cycle sensor histidine kinase and response regulator CckA